MYDSKSLQHQGKLRMHWLGPYEVKTVTDGGVVQLKDLGGTKLRGMINGSQLKLYRDSQTLITKKKCCVMSTSKDNNKGIVPK
jgi:hypothetical protein